MNKRETGSAYENRAAEYLAANGMRIKERNYRNRSGEIDLIARDGEYLVFVEVKTRQEGALVSGFAAVDAGKQTRVRKAAVQYWQAHPTELQPRFDVIEVTLSAAGAKIEHLENAFDGGEDHGVF